MKVSAERAVCVCCAVVCCCLVSSCTQWPLYRMTATEIPALAKSPGERIPLRAGFFMDQELRDILYSGSGVFHWQVYDQGRIKRSVDLDIRAVFEQATRRMFQEVVPVAPTETSKDWKAENLDVVVFVGRASCETEAGRPGLLPRYTALIHATLTAEWSVVSPDGGMILSVRPGGEGQARGFRGVKEALTEAVDAHIEKVYDNIVNSAWWRDSSWKSH